MFFRQNLLQIQQNRNDISFNKILEEVSQKISDLDLDPLTLPRKRTIPKRFTGDGASYNPDNVERYYRQIYFQCMDGVITNLTTRFDCSGDLKEYLALEDVLLTGSVNDIIDKYPEFNSKDMNIQLTMFRANEKPKVTSLRSESCISKYVS